MTYPALTFFLLAACASSAPNKGGADSSADDDGLTTDCTTGAGGVTGVSAAPADMPTVLQVQWNAGDDATTWVEFVGPDGTPMRTPALTGSGAQQALLFGLSADVAVTYRVREDDGQTSWCGETQTTTTGTFAARMPELTLSDDGTDEPAPGFLIGPVISIDTSYVTILNRAGEPVWMVTEPIVNPDSSSDPIAPIMRVRMSRDGQSILFNGMAVSADTDAILYQASLDGGVVTTRNVQGGHTDFTELPDGTILMLGWDARSFDSRVLVGDTIIAVSPDGSQETVWDAFDTFAVDLSKTYEKGYYYADRDAELWTHINSIRYDEDLDGLILTMTMGNAVFVLDRQTYALKWVLSEGAGDFSVVDGDLPGPLMTYPHSAEMIGDDVLVFSRGDPNDTSICAEASEIALDTDLSTATKVWRWQPDDCMIVPFLGDADRLDNGNTLVNFAALGQVDEVSADGDVVQQINTGLGAAFGFVDFLPNPYEEP